MNYWQLLSQNIPSNLELGLINIKIYGIIISIAIIIGIWTSNQLARHKQLPISKLENIYVITILFAIIFARIYHVIDYWNYYSLNPTQIFKIWEGGIGIYGALIGGLIGLNISSKYYQIKLIDLLNTISPGLILGQAIGRWGNFFNQEGFGQATNLPWGIYIKSSLRPELTSSMNFYHPVFLYESLLCLLGFGLLFYLSRKKTTFNYTFGLYSIFYGLIRLFTESFRIDTATIDNIKIATILSIIMIGVGLSNLHRQWRSQSAKIHLS